MNVLIGGGVFLIISVVFSIVLGKVEYPIPESVLLHTRMHLTQDQVQKLLPILQRFAKTGQL